MLLWALLRPQYHILAFIPGNPILPVTVDTQTMPSSTFKGQVASVSDLVWDLDMKQQIGNERSILWEKCIEKEAYSLGCTILREDLMHTELQGGYCSSGRQWGVLLHFQACGCKMGFSSFPLLGFFCSVFSVWLSLHLKHQKIPLTTTSIPLNKWPSLALYSDQIKIDIVHL